MTRTRALHAAVLIFALTLVLPAALHAQAVQRSMYVSVLNEDGVPVPDLGPSDFIVREDNVAREVLRVAPADTPMQVAVLVDNSSVSRDAISDIRNGVTEFINLMTSAGMNKNQLAIIGLADRPTILADYTSDRAKLMNGVGRIFAQPNSGTYLLDGLIEASQALKKREAERPVIVAIATEGAELSDRQHDQVLSAIDAAGVSFHALMLGTPSGSLRTEERERALSLAKGTESTGGRFDNLLTTMALPDRLKQVANELTHQYLVTYARPQSLIPPEKVTVASARKGLTARGVLVKESKEQGRK